jgi:hypothetical protein
MRLAWLAWGLVLVGLVIFPVTEVGAAVVALPGVALLPVLGYRDGSWQGLRWALIVPGAALVADAITFTPLSLQPDSDATMYTYVSLFYLPLWLLLAGAGIAARRRAHGAVGRTAP